MTTISLQPLAIEQVYMKFNLGIDCGPKSGSYLTGGRTEQLVVCARHHIPRRDHRLVRVDVCFVYTCRRLTDLSLIAGTMVTDLATECPVR